MSAVCCKNTNFQAITLRFTFTAILVLTYFVYISQSYAQTVGAVDKSQQKKPQNLLFQLRRAGVFEIFLQALEKSGWQEKLSKTDSYTLFAPTDAAFINVDSVSKELIFSEKAMLKLFVEQHISAGIYRLSDLEAAEKVLTISGTEIPIEKKKPLTLAQAPIVKSDIIADNGIIQVLGSVRLVEK